MFPEGIERASLDAALERIAAIEARAAGLETRATGATPTAAPSSSFAEVLAGYSAAPTSIASTWLQQAGTTAYPLGVRGPVIGHPHQGTHTLYGNWQSQNAVDVSVPVGTPVYAVEDGTVGERIGSLGSTDPRLQGLRLSLVSPGNEYYYAHLSQIVVGPGQQVARGQLLGFSGEANGSPHLHLASRDGDPESLVT